MNLKQKLTKLPFKVFVMGNKCFKHPRSYGYLSQIMSPLHLNLVGRPDTTGILFKQASSVLEY